MESAEQPVHDLHDRVSNELTKTGHPSSPQSVNPHDDSPLQGIKEVFGDAAHVVGTVGTVLTGEEPTTHVRTTTSKSVVGKLRERLFKKAA